MPTYEYQCTTCNDRFERFHRMSDPAVKECPDCGGLVRKVMHPPAIAFKGPGFYVNDYKKAGAPSTDPAPKADAPPPPPPKVETPVEASPQPVAA